MRGAATPLPGASGAARRALGYAAAVLLLLACADGRDSADTATSTEAADGCTDEDGDGWCRGEGYGDDADCDDSNRAAYPGAADCECDCDQSSGACCRESGCDEFGC